MVSTTPSMCPPRLIFPVTPTPRHPWSEPWARLGNSGAREGSPGAGAGQPPPPTLGLDRAQWVSECPAPLGCGGASLPGVP